MISRRHFLGYSAATLVLSRLPPRAFAEAASPEWRVQQSAAVQKGLGYLQKAQNPAGYWSSADFPGLAGLVVQAFLSAGQKPSVSEPVQKGLEFIRKSAKPDGGIYNRGMGNYNTSIALTTLLQAGEQRDRPLIEAARKYLVGAQTKNSVSGAQDGGFGYEAGGSGRMSRPDLDNTVFVLEALALYRASNPAKETPVGQDLNWQAAIDFLTRCQNLPSTNREKWASDDPVEKGGFTYTPGGDDKGTHSYGTMT